MKISRIQIKNYRCLKDLDIDLNDYTALIGANGSGKSSVLYALHWFFRGNQLSAEDVYKPVSGAEPDTIDVTVTFKDLTSRDRDQLEKYGRGDTAVFRRSWTVSDSKSKIIGNAMQGPGFAELRSLTKQGEYRPAYMKLRQGIADLKDLGAAPSKLDIEEALIEWESEESHKSQLLAIDPEDATHLFGFSGQSVIENCFRMILIPAASTITEEVDGTKKGSAIDTLVGALATKASAGAREAWITKYSSAIDELSMTVRKSVEQAAGAQIGRINSRLSALIPDASVDFTPDVPDWVPNPYANILTEVTIDGSSAHISRQGHGVQRAVMIAMFQSIVPDAEYVSAYHEPLEGESDAEAQERLEKILDSLPVIMVCIEEPEIYQHPIRARTFARVLTELASESSAQVLLATHSPYFIMPEEFEGIRRFSIQGNASNIESTSLSRLASTLQKPEEQIRKTLEQKLPSAFSESFFSDAVVVVEGVTDKIVLESLAEIMGKTFDAEGIAIVDVSGKGSIATSKVLLESFSVPTYTIFDGDSNGAQRKYPQDTTKQSQMRSRQQSDTNALLAHLPSSSALIGNMPYQFGDGTIVARHYAIWSDDIEAELESWPSFMSELQSMGEAIRCKDVRVYREAIHAASLNDMPNTLSSVIETILEFKNL